MKAANTVKIKKSKVTTEAKKASFFRVKPTENRSEVVLEQGCVR